MFFTYIVECCDGTLYTGWTKDIDKRLDAHNNGTGAKYTRSRGPVKLLSTWTFPSKNEAMSWEYQTKRLSRSAKLALCLKA